MPLTRTKRLLNSLIPTTGKYLSLEEGRKAINSLSNEKSQGKNNSDMVNIKYFLIN